MDNVPTICFIGLPSGGKSTIINSLIGKRILHSGITRTTEDPAFIGKENIFNKNNYKCHTLKSDDNIEFNVIDLPGINDIEDSKYDFDQITFEWIYSCDIIYWVTEASSAFITRHEKEEFDKIYNMLETESIETGTLYQLGIIINKYDISDSDNEIKDKFYDVKDDYYEIITNNHSSDDEIQDPYEATTIADSYKRVESIFKDVVPIVTFNAHGRILHMNCSGRFKNFIKRLTPSVSSHNIDFNLYNYINDYEEKNSRVIIDSFKHHLDNYIICKNIKLEDTIEKLNTVINKETIDITYMHIYDIITNNYTIRLERLLSIGLLIEFPDYAKQVINDYIDCNSFTYYPGYIKLLYNLIGDTNKFRILYYSMESENRCRNKNYGLFKYYLHDTIIQTHDFLDTDPVYSNKQLIRKCIPDYNMLPEISKYDFELRNNPLLKINKNIQNKILFHRIELYGNQDHVDITMLLLNDNIYSFFAPIENIHDL